MNSLHLTGHREMEGATQKAISPKHLKTLCNLYLVLDRASKSNFNSVYQCHSSLPRVPVTAPRPRRCCIISLSSPSCSALKRNRTWLLASPFCWKIWLCQRVEGQQHKACLLTGNLGDLVPGNSFQPLWELIKRCQGNGLLQRKMGFERISLTRNTHIFASPPEYKELHLILPGHSIRPFSSKHKALPNHITLPATSQCLITPQAHWELQRSPTVVQVLTLLTPDALLVRDQDYFRLRRTREILSVFQEEFWLC